METNEIELKHPDEQKAVVTFKSLGVCEELCESCERLNFKIPTKIQEESLPYTLKNRDIIGLAETGSGKTLAFALPILQALLDNPIHYFAMILSPTRYIIINERIYIIYNKRIMHSNFRTI